MQELSSWDPVSRVVRPSPQEMLKLRADVNWLPDLLVGYTAAAPCWAETPFPIPAGHQLPTGQRTQPPASLSRKPAGHTALIAYLSVLVAPDQRLRHA